MERRDCDWTVVPRAARDPMNDVNSSRSLDFKTRALRACFIHAGFRFRCSNGPQARYLPSTESFAETSKEIF